MYINSSILFKYYSKSSVLKSNINTAKRRQILTTSLNGEHVAYVVLYFNSLLIIEL